MREDILDELNNVNEIICKSFKKYNDDKDYYSGVILSHLRNLLEDVFLLFYNREYCKNLDIKYENKKIAYKDGAINNKYPTLNVLFKFIQCCKSHYTPSLSEQNILLIEQYENLIDLKKLVFEEFKIEIFTDIEAITKITDVEQLEYYTNISNTINYIRREGVLRKPKSQNFYVNKKRSFYINDKVYYELTVSPAIDNAGKYNRFIIYSDENISTNYSVWISYTEANVKLFDEESQIRVLLDWNVSIRPCELNNFAKIFNYSLKISRDLIEYDAFMSFLKDTGQNLLQLVLLEESEWRKLRRNFGVYTTSFILQILSKSRQYIINNWPGSNVLRYLLYTMNNVNIKKQLSQEKCGLLSNLYLSQSCKPFDKIPLVMSLHLHNPRGVDLYNCIDTTDRDHEILARKLRNNIEQAGILYTPLMDLDDFNCLDELIKNFNNLLYNDSQLELKIKKYKDYIYMEGYERDTIEIINSIKDLAKEGVDGYKSAIESWISKCNVDISEEKKVVANKLFNDSHVALVYGAAGTGKTKFISFMSEYFNGYNKTYLSVTNTAKENLSRVCGNYKSSFHTVSEFLSNCSFIDSDILIIDECSTLNNRDMINILKNAKFNLLLLVGDIYQIESINYGNWFSYCKYLNLENCIFEFKDIFRSTEGNLLEIWNAVRKKDKTLSAKLTKYKFSSSINMNIFEKSSDDEIILCLNYDGLYGINQINRFMQEKNHNKSVSYGAAVYKVGDPILFTDNFLYQTVFYNNLKGIIVDLEESKNEIKFVVDIYASYSELDFRISPVRFIGNNGNDTTRVEFSIEKDLSNDEDIVKNNVIPFTIAYASSIHKAQGLEFDSVKVIVSDNVDELISQNIFYTAVTRTKNLLKIFWNASTRKKVLNNIIKRDENLRDLNLLKEKYKL